MKSSKFRRRGGLLAVVAVLLSRATASAAAFPPSGSLDPTFGNGGLVSLPIAAGQATDEAFAVAIQDDGRIVVAGYTTPSPQKFAVARLLADGTLDTSFNGIGKLSLSLRSVQDRVQAIAIQDDGKILLGGYSRAAGSDDFALVRLLPNGTLDTSFGIAGKVITAVGANDDRIQALAVQDDGKIIAAGYVKQSNFDLALVRYEADGSEDPTFGVQGRRILAVGTGNDEISAVALQSDGAIVVAGSAADGSNYDMLVARFTPNGAPDTTFNGSGSARVEFDGGDDFAAGLAIQPDGRILAAGTARIGTQNRFAAARFLSTGAIDGSFGIDGRVSTPIGTNAEGRGLVLHPRGRFVVAGRARVDGKWNFALAQYRPNGSLDPTFGDHGLAVLPVGTQADEAYAVAVQSDGAVVAAGTTRASSNANFGLLRVFVNDCGDGFVDDDETCDSFEIGDASCCSTECTLLEADTVCRATGGSCDLPETCDGLGAECPADEWLPASTSCRPAAGDCDVAESCDGLGPLCPADQRVPADTICRAGIDLCDAAERCNGVSATCPDDALAPSGTVCRASTAACDAAEVCNGAEAGCPGDALAAAGTGCRPANGACDVAESCDGAQADCPDDAVAPPGTSCRASGNACDLEDFCDGSSTACPDQRLPDGDADGTCDAIDVCPETSDPQQTDGDTDGIGDLCDPCTNGLSIAKAVVRIGDFTTPAGDDTFTLRGNLKFGVTPPLFPEIHGVRVLIEDATGAVLFDVLVPGGTFDETARLGWKINSKRTVMIFKSPGAAIGGLVNQVKLVARTARPGLVQVSVSGHGGSFAQLPIALPLHATFVLDPSAAALGRCGEAGFTGIAPAATCGFNEDGTNVVCR